MRDRAKPPIRPSPRCLVACAALPATLLPQPHPNEVFPARLSQLQFFHLTHLTHLHLTFQDKYIIYLILIELIILTGAN